MKTNIDIISGFLGAGKTTLIKKLANESLQKENIVIIENEFGEIGIDSNVLKNENLKVREINAGCICCTVKDDFKNAAIEIINKYHPSRIIIEPSGVAKLTDILQIFSNHDLKYCTTIHVVTTVVDALKYNTYLANFGEFYKNQIINCKTVVLSRTSDLDAEKIQNIVLSISKLNKRANIITTPWNKLSSEKILETMELDSIKPLDKEVNLLNKSTYKFSINHCANEVFDTFGIETPKVFNRQCLKQKLSCLNDAETFGMVLRAKGIVETEENHWIKFDFVPNEIKIVDTYPDYTGRLCIIGSNLNKENIKKLLLK